MVFYTGKIVLALDNPTVLVITGRNDLDTQLFDTFAATAQLPDMQLPVTETVLKQAEMIVNELATK